MQKIHDLLNAVEGYVGLKPTTSGSFVNNLADMYVVKQLTLACKNSERALEITLDRIVTWSSADDYSDYDAPIAIVLMALIMSDCMEGQIMSSSVAQDDNVPTAQFIATSYLLKNELNA